MSVSLPRLALASATLCAVAVPVSAAPFVYEGFDTSATPNANQYQAGATINGAGHGSGSWTSEWTTSATYTAQTGSLAYGGLQTTDGKLSTSTTAGNATRLLDSAGFAALGDEVWFSFAFNRGAGGKQFNFRFADRVAANRYIGLAVANNSSDLRAVINTDNVTTLSSASTATIVTDQTHFVLGRITFDAVSGAANLDRLDIWFDPVLTTDLGALGAPTMFVEGDWTNTQGPGAGTTHNAIDRIFISTGVSDVLVDEIRVGAALGDVVVIPEPAGALLMLAGGALIARRRR